ncbi:hypothetical protein OQA88_8796 [Cercophora sp. LCS_1]
MSTKTPVFLLKTKSAPADAYEEQFSATADGFDFEPVFVPVLEHRFDDQGLSHVRHVLKDNGIGRAEGKAYGGMIFTSQRAVEAFSSLVQEGQFDFPDVPVYSVGPATTRALKAVPTTTRLHVFGEHTGNGGTLAPYIIEHYGEWYKDRAVKPPLLFLVGAQRSVVIPRVLTAASIHAEEVVVYNTGVMESFRTAFGDLLRKTADRPKRWVIVFSPTGCNSMLEALGLLEGKPRGQSPTTYIATIGPTTRDYLVNKFAFHPDVCAAQPSPEGVWNGITQFSRT